MAAGSETQNFMEKAIGMIAGEQYLGGELKAAMFQGASELGTALKAFPDAIQVEEPGAAWNPLYRDRDGVSPAHANDNQPDLPTPSQIAEGVQPQGSVHGDPQASPSLPTPSEIASNPTPYLPAQDQGTAHGQDMGREM